MSDQANGTPQSFTLCQEEAHFLRTAFDPFIPGNISKPSCKTTSNSGGPVNDYCIQRIGSSTEDINNNPEDKGHISLQGKEVIVCNLYIQLNYSRKVRYPTYKLARRDPPAIPERPCWSPRHQGQNRLSCLPHTACPWPNYIFNIKSVIRS